jgi:hypothetical protein
MVEPQPDDEDARQRVETAPLCLQTHGLRTHGERTADGCTPYTVGSGAAGAAAEALPMPLNWR